MPTPYAEVIGDPIIQSKSPFVHNFWLQELDIEADYRATRVPADALPVYLSARRNDPDWRGCNVTMPLKQAVIEHLDDMDKAADESEAVNMIYRRHDGSLIGLNHDVLGFLEAMEEGQARANLPPAAGFMNWEIVGAGGAARAVGHALGSMQLPHFFSRDVEDAIDLARLFSGGTAYGHDLGLLASENWDAESDFGRLVSLRPHHRTMIVNATPLGMTGYPSLPIRLDLYPADTIVFDLVTDPPCTPLLAEARRRGMPTIDGIDMLIAQAAWSFERFFSEPAPRYRDEELASMLRQ